MEKELLYAVWSHGDAIADTLGRLKMVLQNSTLCLVLYLEEQNRKHFIRLFNP